MPDFVGVNLGSLAKAEEVNSDNNTNDLNIIRRPFLMGNSLAYTLSHCPDVMFCF